MERITFWMVQRKNLHQLENDGDKGKCGVYLYICEMCIPDIKKITQQN